MQLRMRCFLGTEVLARLPSLSAEDLLAECCFVASPFRIVRIVVYFAATI